MNLNRGDTGRPKSLIYSGTEVSASLKNTVDRGKESR